MISMLYVLNLTGDVIIEHFCSEKIPRSLLEEFWTTHVAPATSFDAVAPVAAVSRYVFVTKRVHNVIFVAVTSAEQPPMVISEILTLIAGILKTYVKEVREAQLRENFSLVYQLLEEVLDNGFPLTTELHVLEQLVPRPTLENKMRSIFDTPKKNKLGDTTVPWRNPGIKYTNNEVFFDLVDIVDVTVNNDGRVIRAAVRGSIEVVSKLSGMPDVAAHLTNSDVLDDVAFHPCVRHSRYEADRTLSFVPPDGAFTLAQYRCKPSLTFEPPFYVTPQISFNKETGRISIMAGLRHGGMNLSQEERNIHKMFVTVPLPQCTESIDVTACTWGSYTFDPVKKVVRWSIGQLSGQTTPSFSASVTFAAGTQEALEADGSTESVSVEYQVPNVGASGLRVNTVNVLNESYRPFKGVKYITKAGRFTIHTA